MEIFKVFFYLSFPIILYASKDCPISSCGKGDNKIIIRFPFKLENENRPNCGYPGFNLICTKNGKTILKLPNSEEVYVHSINYATQQIQVIDPNDRLHKRLMSLNFKDSPFTATYSSGKLKNELSGNLNFEWNLPDCSPCEMQQQLCAIHDGQVSCSPDPEAKAGDSNQGHNKIMEFVALCIGGVVGLIIILCTCWFFYKTCSQSSLDDTASSNFEISLEEAEVTTKGLDKATIESYETIKLGEEDVKDEKCSICLAEYKKEEKLRIIPGCNHRFHVDCIDEWLSKNTTCPVCRNNP